MSPAVVTTTVAPDLARLTWPPDATADELRLAVAEALTTHHRVEAHIDPADETALRLATWSGLRREGVMRGRPDRVVLARLADDVPVHEPDGFRALLNSFLPRKRAIAQLLVRDTTEPEPRVLLCRLTYKQDWDLPGGVVEVGESPQLAAGRELLEELALDVTPGPLLLTDWLPPWGGWDDALCLVFDGGVHDPALVDGIVRQAREIQDAGFCTMAQAHERCADFTARRLESALANLAGGPAYAQSGRAPGLGPAPGAPAG